MASPPQAHWPERVVGGSNRHHVLGGSKRGRSSLFCGRQPHSRLYRGLPFVGPVCGILQWQILKRQVAQAGWWALTLPLSWVVGFAVYAAVGFAVNLTLASPALGATFGATTGGALVWLLRRAAPAPARALVAWW